MYIFVFQYIRYIIYRVWQNISKTVLSKFVLYSDCVYIVLSTCVEFVNAFDQVISVEGRQVVY